MATLQCSGLENPRDLGSPEWATHLWGSHSPGRDCSELAAGFLLKTFSRPQPLISQQSYFCDAPCQLSSPFGKGDSSPYDADTRFIYKKFKFLKINSFP